jgi:hypothetical protein
MAIWVALAPSVYAAGPSANRFTCATCHRAQSESQPETPMGIGIELPSGQALLKARPKMTFEKNGYTYVIERKKELSTYTVSDGAGSLELPVTYAFGIDMQTFVLERQGRFYESLVSYYPGVGGLAITMGSERMQPHNLVEAMGRELSRDETTTCFGCHSSGAVSHGQLHLESLRPGLDCEHCHTGSSVHLQAMQEGKPDRAPQKLGKMSSEDISNFCGTCHRRWDAVVRMRLWGEINVRFQPYRLANSKCFLGDDSRISCTACHDPHRQLVRDDATYDRNCLACHSSSGGQRVCAAAKDKCVSCHMPKVELPGSHAVFTDHQIRTVHAGDPYPN